MSKKTIIILIVIVLAIYFLTKKYSKTSCGAGGINMGHPCNGFEYIMNKINPPSPNIA